MRKKLGWPIIVPFTLRNVSNENSSDKMQTDWFPNGGPKIGKRKRKKNKDRWTEKEGKTETKWNGENIEGTLISGAKFSSDIFFIRKIIITSKCKKLI